MKATIPNSILKDGNPKDLIGSGKIPLHLWPETASVYGALGLLDGMLKYGRSNWRVGGVRASIYVDACKRHLDFWFEGEDFDPDSKLPHLCHALACLAILVDSICSNNMVDDRQIAGGLRKAVTDMTGHVARLKELHAHRTDVKHYTIKDNQSGLLVPTHVKLDKLSPGVAWIEQQASKEGKAV